jgi:hypothetical protein
MNFFSSGPQNAKYLSNLQDFMSRDRIHGEYRDEPRHSKNQFVGTPPPSITSGDPPVYMPHRFHPRKDMNPTLAEFYRPGRELLHSGRTM